MDSAQPKPCLRPRQPCSDPIVAIGGKRNQTGRPTRPSLQPHPATGGQLDDTLRTARIIAPHQRLRTARRQRVAKDVKGVSRLNRRCFEEAKVSNGKMCCPTCGKDNACGMANGAASCWCFAMPHVLPVSTTDAAARCYCRACLARVIAAQTASSRSRPDRP